MASKAVHGNDSLIFSSLFLSELAFFITVLESLKTMNSNWPIQNICIDT